MEVFNLRLYAKLKNVVLSAHYLDVDVMAPLMQAKATINKTLESIVETSGSEVYDINVQPVFEYMDDGAKKISEIVGIEAGLKIANVENLEILPYLNDLYKSLLEYGVELDLEELKEQGYSLGGKNNQGDLDG